MGGQAGFGEWLRNCREKADLSLRAFALKAGIDPGNLSKYERGVLPAPQDPETLARIGKALRFGKGTSEMQELQDIAAASSGHIPPDLANDPQVVQRMPLLFRTARGKLTRDELIALAEQLRSI
jgi:transcriptional regulator with XRE-family HTH domain